MGTRDPHHRIIENPFYVLGLSTQCSRAEAERQGQKLLDMLAVGLSAAKTYSSPLGVHERTAEKIREAMAELRDPERRLIHELWAQIQPPPQEDRPGDGNGRPAAKPSPAAGHGPGALAVPAAIKWRDGAARAGWRARPKSPEKPPGRPS